MKLSALNEMNTEFDSGTMKVRRVHKPPEGHPDRMTVLNKTTLADKVVQFATQLAARVPFKVLQHVFRALQGMGFTGDPKPSKAVFNLLKLLSPAAVYAAARTAGVAQPEIVSLLTSPQFWEALRDVKVEGVSVGDALIEADDPTRRDFLKQAGAAVGSIAAGPAGLIKALVSGGLSQASAAAVATTKAPIMVSVLSGTLQIDYDEPLDQQFKMVLTAADVVRRITGKSEVISSVDEDYCLAAEIRPDRLAAILNRPDIQVNDNLELYRQVKSRLEAEFNKRAAQLQADVTATPVMFDRLRQTYQGHVKQLSDHLDKASVDLNITLPDGRDVAISDHSRVVEQVSSGTRLNIDEVIKDWWSNYGKYGGMTVTPEAARTIKRLQLEPPDPDAEVDYDEVADPWARAEVEKMPEPHPDYHLASPMHQPFEQRLRLALGL